MSEAIERFLHAVCLQVKAKEIHKEIRLEMGSHLEEMAVEKEREGATFEEAVAWAVRQMGDPAEIGRSLNQIHKPKVHWELLGALMILVALGLAAMYSVDTSRYEMNKWTSFSKNMIIVSSMGCVLMFGLYWLDYRKLEAYSWALYGLTVTAQGVAHYTGHKVNGAGAYLSIGSVNLDINSFSPYLFIVSAAGLLLGWQRGRRAYGLQLLWLVAVPCFLFLKASSLVALVLYLTAYTVLYGALTRKWWLTAIQSGLVVGMLGGVTFFVSRQARERLLFILAKERDPQGAGWIYNRIEEVLTSAGWRGHGTDAIQNTLPYIHSDMLLPYLIYSYGWWAGLLIAGISAFFISRLLVSAFRVRELYGKMLITGLSALLCVQFVWSIGMATGWLPVSSVPLPFVSYGGSHMLVELSAVGLILSVYRRKDTVRTTAAARRANQ